MILSGFSVGGVLAALVAITGGLFALLLGGKGETRFVVKVPAETPADAELFLAGDFQNWQPGVNQWRLERRRDGRWMHAVSRDATNRCAAERARMAIEAVTPCSHAQ